MFDFLTNAFSSLFSSLSSKRTLDAGTIDGFLAKINDALLEADVPYELVQTFITSLREKIEKKQFKSGNQADQLLAIVYDAMIEFLGGKDVVPFTPKPGSVIMVLGLQGSGKTTTIMKLAHALIHRERAAHKNAPRVLLASVDYYRPAAIEQLEIGAQRSGAEFFRAQSTDCILAVQEIYAYFKNRNFDFLILDTAGRMHIKAAMIDELVHINRFLEPSQKILVLDSMTGQESLAVARTFDREVGFDSAILTKTDSDSRGGALFSFRYALKKPILFLGNGEKPADLDPYNPARLASRILGMGDLEGLAAKVSKQEGLEQEQMTKNFGTDAFTLADFAKQLDMMGKIGSLSTIASYIPGLGNMKIDPEVMKKGEKELAVFKAIIQSMTSKERSYPRLLNDSRKKRVAKGAGVGISEVNKLLQRFEEMQQYAKLMKKMGGFNGMLKGR